MKTVVFIVMICVFADINIHIPLQLWGIFSYFHARVPTSDNINQRDKVLFAPDSSTWDPYSDFFLLMKSQLLVGRVTLFNKKEVNTAIAASFYELIISEEKHEFSSMD